MADRASVAIRIGGSLSPDLLSGFCAAVASDGAFTDWEGTAFDPTISIRAFLCTWPTMRLLGAGSRRSRLSVSIMPLSSSVGLAALLGRSARSGWSLTARPFEVSAPRTMTRS